MMDELYTALDIVPDSGKLLLTGFHVERWGRDLVFRGRCDDSFAFALHFADCREIKWRVYVHAPPTTNALLADVRLGRSAHRSPAHLLTDFFGVSLVYGALNITKGDLTVESA